MKIILLIFSFVSVFGLNAQNDICTCCTAQYKAFDFWIGTWNVTKPDGSFAGKNVIDKIQDKCVVRENWTGAAAGYSGTSYNFYNTQTKQWEQIWIDNQGGTLHLKGNREGSRMILRSDALKNKQGQPFYHRVTWTKNEDGTVRQLWETITNNKNSVVVFDGLYRKVQ